MEERENNILQGSLQILKTLIISLPPNSPKNASGHHFPHRSTPMPSSEPPTRKQVDNPSRHNPRHPQTAKENTPQSRNHITMKKKMVHKLSISLTHAASIYNKNMSFPEIIQSKNFA
jgi:predicted component of type VI protein secretion system